MKKNGLFCFSIQLGDGEEYVDEPYLEEKGKEALYMYYETKNQIKDLLKNSNFNVVYEHETIKTGSNEIGENENDAIYIIARKRECNG